MFVYKIKGVLAVALVVGLALGGIGVGVGISTNPMAVAQQPGAKTDGKAASLPGDKEKTGDQALEGLAVACHTRRLGRVRATSLTL